MEQKSKYRPIMVVGTGSHVGKSVLVAGLCRVMLRRGVKVAPFKAQNMALNSGITKQGHEIGRAQITQAEAAGVEPHVDMNPILLKPTSDVGSQVILNGKVFGNYKGIDYYRLKPKLLKHVMSAFERLSEDYQLVILEGAGSCCEMNLKEHDLVNLPMAVRAGAKVILAADIDAGGVFGQVVGNLDLMTRKEKGLLAGVVINKFRGDPKLFQNGVDYLEERTGIPILGVLPMFTDIELPQEDGVALERASSGSKAGSVRVGVVRLSRISNFTDADALGAEPSVDLRWVKKPEELCGLDLLILPGTKNTLAALAALNDTGLFEGIRAYHSLGGKVLGLCGGYQLMGESISDPEGVEGPPGRRAPGLCLLQADTVMQGEKTTTRVTARALSGLPFEAQGVLKGYEIHMGETKCGKKARPAFRLITRLDKNIDAPEGLVSTEGRAVGTYLHGILDNDALRAGVLAWAAGDSSLPGLADYAAFKDRQYDLLADLMEEHLDLENILEPLDA